MLQSKLRAVSTILDAKLEKEAVPGAAFAIVSDQEKVWSYQYGVEDLEIGTSVTEDTAFSICSVSKLFTGIAVMDLEEQGAIDLDAPLIQYLGTDAGPSNASGEPVSVRNILSHVSGLPREGETDFWVDNNFPDDAELRADIADREDWYVPFDHWQYSNLGLAALGQVISAASGQNFHDYVKSEILDALGMENTTTDMPFDRVGEGFARGYYVRNSKGERKPVQSHSFKAFAPAAGIASSINDLASFMSWHFRLRDSDAEEVLEPSTLRQMQRVHWTGEDFDEPKWGLAYATRRYGKKTMWGHGGYCPGSVTEFVMRNSDKVGVIAMATANDVSASQMARMVYDMTASELKAVKKASDEDSTSSEDTKDSVSLEEFEGHYYRPNYDWDVYIGQTKEGLFAVPLHSDTPQDNVALYRHEEGDRFIRLRKDESDAEPMLFSRNGEGEITEVVRGGYRLIRK
ncbi:MAG: serine hydrolase [Pseudomonadota bacterium]